MCLGIPARIVGISNAAARLARVDQQGRLLDVNIGAIVPAGADLHDCIGHWVLVHQGFATSRVDEREAQLTLSLLDELAVAQAQLRAAEG